MVRTLVIETEKDIARCETLFGQFCLGRALALNVDMKGEQKREDRRVDLAALKVFQAVSDEVSNGPKYHGDVATRTFRAGETLRMKQADMDRIDKYVDRAPCDTGKLDSLEDALGWWATAAKVDE